LIGDRRGLFCGSERVHNLSKRVLRPELLDIGQLPLEEVRRSLLDLRRINRIFGARRIVLDALAREISRRGLHQFSVLDIASGSCDHPMAVLDWAQQRKLKAQVFALEYQFRHLWLFRQEHSAYPDLHPFCADAFHAPVLNHAFDYVTCGHFFHHLTEERATDLLSSMAKWARYAVIVIDLERHWLPYYFFRIFNRLFTTSSVSRIDGRISLEQSFRKNELEQIAERAELSAYSVERRWPFQLLLIGNAERTTFRGAGHR